MDTIIIKKGTILFRIVHTKETNFLRDFYGKQEDDNDFCLAPNYNVFFYFTPYMSDTSLWFNYKVRKMIVYELQYDIEVLNFILPLDSNNKLKYIREDINLDKLNIIKKCDNFELCNGLYKGIKSDYCLTNDYIKKNPKILGMINIVEIDNKHLKQHLKKNKNKWIKQFMGFFKNKNGLIGVPELSIYPLNYRNTEHIIYKNEPDKLINNIANNITKYNYTIKAVFDHQPFKKDELYNFVKNKLVMKNGFYYFKAAI
jgi:hypothetical protein